MSSTLSQVRQMISRNKLFSGIYIFGTALALATVTIGAVIFYNKIAPVYPEYQRPRMAYIQSVAERNGAQLMQSRLSWAVWNEHLSKLKNADEASAYYDTWDASYAQPADGSLSFEVRRKPTDPAFFRIYDLDFKAGGPFSQADFDSGLRKIVISDKTARRVYATDDYESLIGRPFSLDFEEYTVCGVFREGTPTEVHSYANVIYPYTSVEDYDKDHKDNYFPGNYIITYLTDDIDALRAEVSDLQARYNNSHEGEEKNVDFFNQPTEQSYVGLTGESYHNGDSPGEGSIWLMLGGVLLVLMLVPALNLSGIISGQMEGRLAEMGVRKAFGAGRGRLLGKILLENLILTVIGGAVGFVIAYIALKSGMTGLFASGDFTSESVVTDEMIFAPAIFAFTFLMCCVLNLFSALMPAWRSLRKPIVASLKS